MFKVMALLSSFLPLFLLDKTQSPDVLATSVLPLRYVPVPDKFCPIRKKKIMSWPATLSTFILNKVCQLINKGVYMDIGFRQMHLEAITDDVFKYCGHRVT
jgi:hypothetical protein